MPQMLPNGRIVLKFSMGTNSKTREPQWKAYADGKLYIPHRKSQKPTEDEQKWEATPDFEAGDGVVVVWLLEQHVSQTQQRKSGREVHRQFANA